MERNDDEKGKSPICMNFNELGEISVIGKVPDLNGIIIAFDFWV